VPVIENGANPHEQRDVPVVPVSKSGKGLFEPEELDLGTASLDEIRRAHERGEL